MQVAKYTSRTPLNANGFFAPLEWVSTEKYNFYDITLIADKKCRITVEFSIDKFNITKQEIYYTLASVVFNTQSAIFSGYFRLRVDNLESSNMNNFSLATYFRGENINRTIKNSTLWDNVSSGVGGVSSVLSNNYNCNNFSFYGNVSSATVLTLEISNNGDDWFSTQYSYTASGSGNFGFNVSLITNYLRVYSSNNITISLLVNGN